MELNVILANKRSASDFLKLEYHVYFLLKGEEVVYVGKTEDYKTRIKKHSGDKDFDSFYLVKFDTELEMSVYEFEMIAKYKPKYNKSLPGVKEYPSISKTKDLLGLKGWDFKRFLKKHNIEPYVDFDGTLYYELKVLKERGVV